MESEQNAPENRLPEYADSGGTNSAVNTVSHPPNGSDSIPEETSKCGEAEELARGLPNDIFVYRQDVVGCKKHEDKLGVIMEVAGDMESEGSITDESDSEDDKDKGGSRNSGGDDDAGNNNGNSDGSDRNDSLSDGEVRVVWTDGFETTENISDITVVDRGFLHGDIVTSVSDPMGQLGLVVDVSITVDLQAANGEVIKNVSSRHLKRVREFTVGDYVVHGPWLGRVDDVLDNVTVMFDDGSVCKVVKADPLRLKPISKASIDDANCPYYPGQRVRAVSSSVFKSSRWLSGLWKSNRLEGTVIKVQPGSVVVYWIASAYLGVGTNSTSVPAEEQSPKNLTLLSCFSYASWQLGDWCLLPSPSLPSLSSIVGNSTTNNLKEPNKGCKSKTGECAVEESLDTHTNSCTETSEQGLNLPILVSEEHQTTELPFLEAARQEDTVYSSQVVCSDVHDLQTVSGHLSDECSMNSLTSRNFKQSQSSGNVNIDRQNKFGETNGNELVSGLPECGSCSSSSVTKESAHESWSAHRKKLRKIFFKRDKKSRKREEDFERALCIINTVTKVDVAWQDGTRRFRLDSKSLIPIHTPNDHEFFPEQYVVEKVTTEGDDSSETKHVGVVRSVNSKDRTVCVRWLKPASRPEDLKEFDCDEVVSAYELDEHPDYDYCYGDVVVRLSPVSASGDTANFDGPVEEQVQQDDPSEAAGDVSRNYSDNEEAEQKCDDESCANFTCLSWVGNITGLNDGYIEVTWADGMVSKVGPQAVYVVGREDDGESFDGGSEVSDDAASWETVGEDQMDSVDDTEKEADLESSTNKTCEEEKSTSVPEEESNVQNGRLSMPLAALGFVTRLATGLFSRGRKQLGQSASSDVVVSEMESEENLKIADKEAACSGVSIEESGAPDTYVAQNEHEVETGCNYVSEKKDAGVKMEENLDSPLSLERNAAIPGSDNKDEQCSFKHFDITENPLDHHFLGGSGQSTGGRKWVKKVHQEWSILEKNLPDDIYVRVFEDRMDLLRAVIIGAPGTPYQDGLFFFDFHLPSEYPQVPPSAYYHSGGLRINPNLYVEGKVCLSLLNTWTGRENEVWDPSSSSILQVLVSLQGLVLNAKPYFNEAGYEKQVGTIEGEKNSLPYNENTYLLNLKSMMYLLRRPPMHFEDFVKDHFRKRGRYILKACEAYMSGCLIGSLTKDACMTEKSREQSCSVGFKLMLAKLLPRLMSALSDVGVDRQEFGHLPKT